MAEGETRPARGRGPRSGGRGRAAPARGRGPRPGRRGRDARPAHRHRRPDQRHQRARAGRRQRRLARTAGRTTAAATTTVPAATAPTAESSHARAAGGNVRRDRSRRRGAEPDHRTQPGRVRGGQVEPAPRLLCRAPDDVQPEPGGRVPPDRPRTSRAGSSIPAPASSTTTAGTGPGRTDTAKPVPTGVCAKMLPSSASTAAARSSAATGTGTGPSGRSSRTGRSCSSASTDQNSTRSRTTATASASPPVSRVGRRACAMTWLTIRSTPATAASTRSASSGSRSPSASSRSAVTGVRSRWDRSAAASRSCCSRSLIRSASPLSASAIRRTSAGSAGVARADRSPLRSESAVPATDSSGRTSPRPISPATSPAAGEQHQPEHDQRERRPPDSPVQRRVRDERPHHSDRLRGRAATRCTGASTGTSTARPPSMSTVPAALRSATRVDRVVRRRRRTELPRGRRLQEEDGRLPARAGVESLQPAGHQAVVVDVHQRRRRLRLHGGLDRLPAGGHVPHQRQQRHQERDHDQRGDRERQQDDPAGHVAASGSTSLTPTPRTVCR